MTVFHAEVSRSDGRPGGDAFNVAVDDTGMTEAQAIQAAEAAAIARMTTDGWKVDAIYRLAAGTPAQPAVG